jgi:CRISPR/Cas system endoribonuclease Cas6 (RAMP superfamily)
VLGELMWLEPNHSAWIESPRREQSQGRYVAYPSVPEITHIIKNYLYDVLVIAYCLLKRKEQYVELGADYFDKKNPDALRRSLVRRLERLGNKVILEPAVQII